MQAAHHDCKHVIMYIQFNILHYNMLEIHNKKSLFFFRKSIL